jgi:sugar phosphate isomerase/epimerase
MVRTARRDVGLEHLTMLDLAPPELEAVAAEAGFSTVGIRVSPVTQAERAWPMSPGSPMLAEAAARCAQTGIRVLGVEAIHPGARAQDTEPIFETAAALGARYAIVLCDDPDVSSR